ncbi:hypothetical protein GALL_23560 [mine drainage metagenome]|uniref:Uncharacterized protein n=1 Tax=mine drainage metagenome TaxID=410659 RepID=A0A1J5TB41_9ZZZZ
MRYVPSLPPVTTSPYTRQVKGLSAAQAVKPVYPREQPESYVAPQATHQAAAGVQQQPPRRVQPFEDRRKACRRVSHQPVLVELRSGIDRRRHNLREGDMVEHIDEQA